MKLALFFALVLISGTCAEFIMNEFASRLKFPSCEPVTMRPTWLFESKLMTYLLCIAVHENAICWQKWKHDFGKGGGRVVQVPIKV